MLDPAWRIWTYSVPPPCPGGWNVPTSYSLTDHPGYLRFYLGTRTDLRNACDYGDYASMHLYREIEGTTWTLETYVAYHAPYGGNAPNHVTYLYFGDLEQFAPTKIWESSLIIYTNVWDGWHRVYLIENGGWTVLANLPIYHGHDAFYYRFTRSGNDFALEWSRDGITYAPEIPWTLSPGTASLSQAFGISGRAWGSDPAIHHAEYDYVRVT